MTQTPQHDPATPFAGIHIPCTALHALVPRLRPGVCAIS